MVSQHRNAGPELTAANAIPEQRILDAAYDLLVSIGMRKTTMADIARSAGVSRATLYRRWRGVNDVVAALMTREWAKLGTAALHSGASNVREVLVSEVVRLVREIREHRLLRTIIDLDSEILLPYLLHRRGRSTNEQLATLEKAIAAGIGDGSIRPGEVEVRAQAVLLTAWSFVLTGPVFAGGEGAIDALDEQLRELLERYLAP